MTLTDGERMVLAAVKVCETHPLADVINTGSPQLVILEQEGLITWSPGVDGSPGRFVATDQGNRELEAGSG